MQMIIKRNDDFDAKGDVSQLDAEIRARNTCVRKFHSKVNWTVLLSESNWFYFCFCFSKKTSDGRKITLPVFSTESALPSLLICVHAGDQKLSRLKWTGKGTNNTCVWDKTVVTESKKALYRSLSLHKQHFRVPTYANFPSPSMRERERKKIHCVFREFYEWLHW
jgi:hypothetical protein